MKEAMGLHIMGMDYKNMFAQDDLRTTSSTVWVWWWITQALSWRALICRVKCAEDRNRCPHRAHGNLFFWHLTICSCRTCWLMYILPQRGQFSLGKAGFVLPPICDPSQPATNQKSRHKLDIRCIHKYCYMWKNHASSFIHEFIVNT